MSNKPNLLKLFKKLWYHCEKYSAFFNDENRMLEIASVQPFYVYDICLNCLSMIIAQMENNISVGFDISIRAIIESFSIFKAIGQNELTNKQLSLIFYGRSYMSAKAHLDVSNAREMKLINDFFESEMKRAIAYTSTTFSLNEEESIRILKDHYSFLKYGDKQIGKTASSFIAHELGEKFKEIRNFCSASIHPSYYSEEIYEKVIKEKLSIADLIYLIVDNMLPDINVNDKSIPSYQKFKNKYIGEQTLATIDEFKIRFKKAANVINQKHHISYSLKRIKELLIDITLFDKIPFSDIKRNRYKTIVEYLSILTFITDDELAFMWQLMSDYKAQKYLGINDKDKINKLVDLVANRYKIASKIEIKEQLESNDLFFLKGAKTNYMPMVNEALNRITHFRSEIDKSLIKTATDESWTLYKFYLNDTHPGIDLYRHILDKKQSPSVIFAHVFMTYIYIGGKDEKLINFLYFYKKSLD